VRAADDEARGSAFATEVTTNHSPLVDRGASRVPEHEKRRWYREGMATITPSDVARLSDADLLAQTQRAAQCEWRSTVQLIALLMEIDARRPYLQEGFSSLFTYCTDAPRELPPRNPTSRHIPAAVKRAVWQRDGGRCGFRGTQGRCSETAPARVPSCQAVCGRRSGNGGQYRTTLPAAQRVRSGSVLRPTEHTVVRMTLRAHGGESATGR
jgi:hypothetical protein